MDEGLVRVLAAHWGWAEAAHNAESRVLGFTRGGMRVNVYYSTGTVGTCLDHPRRGKTQLFRRGQSLETLSAIFEDPRVHTGAGYYRRHSAARPEPSQRAPGRALTAHLPDAAAEAELHANFGSPAPSAPGGGREVVCLALGGAGFFAVERRGGCWWRGVPVALDGLMAGRPRSGAPVDFAALGPGGSYFVQFADGTHHLSSEGAALRAALASRRGSPVEALAFAPGGGFWVMWEDGVTQRHRLPPGAEARVADSEAGRLAPVEAVALGPSDEWYVRHADCACASGGLEPGCAAALAALADGGRGVADVAFGEGGAWAVVHE
ncbi:MAG: hypothetical protein J3K34DRAFT_435653 [Monoraphidium minutum]|nr:MAG: hypothetical protein J3K34DRAFT_435653 [Monoraphidium minutum]